MPDLNDLIEAISSNNSAAALKLLDNPALFKLAHGNYNHALFLAVENNLNDVAKKLLESEKIRKAAHYDNNAIIREAVFNANEELIELLLKLPNVVNTNYSLVKETWKEFPSLSSEPGMTLIRITKLCGIPLSILLGQLSNDVAPRISEFIKDPIAYITKYQTLSPLKLTTFKALYFLSEYNRFENIDETETESAENPNLMILANNKFAEIVNHYRNVLLRDYAHYSNAQLQLVNDGSKSPKEIIEAELSVVPKIEDDIKSLLLATILFNAKQRTPRDDATIRFVETNYSALLSGNSDILKQSLKVLTSCDDIAQIAWRAYHAIYPTLGYDNLIAPMTLSDKTIYSTPEALESAPTLTEASLIVRRRLAYYYLALMDKEYSTNLEKRKKNFIELIAEMQRAHNEDENQFALPDRPSCFPGYLTRIAYTGDDHPIAELKLSSTAIIESYIRDHIFTKFTNLITFYDKNKISAEQLLTIYKSIALIDTRNGVDIILDKFQCVLADDPSSKLVLESKLADAREQFITMLGSPKSILKLINAELQKHNFPNLLTEEQLYFVERFIYDPGFKGNAQGIYDLLPKQVQEMVADKNVSKTSKSEGSQFTNPFIVPKNTSPNPLLARTYERKKAQHETFEAMKSFVSDIIKEETSNTNLNNLFNWQEFLNDFCQEFPGWESPPIDTSKQEKLKMYLNDGDNQKRLKVLQDPELRQSILQKFISGSFGSSNPPPISFTPKQNVQTEIASPQNSTNLKPIKTKKKM